MKQLACALLLVLSAFTAGADEPLPQALPEEQETAALRDAERIGRAMFLHDRAAAVATDVVLAQTSAKKDGRLRGWVTEARQDGIVVTFIDETPAALYRVVVSAEGKPGDVTVLETPEALSPYEAGAAKARQAAMGAGFKPCAENYNSVVIPADAGATTSWSVYMLPGTTRHDLVPIGGSYRFDVKDGQVVSQRAFTRTCIALPVNPKEVGALMITHLLDPVPTEVHMFWSLWSRRPMYVATPPHGTVWGVANDGIGLIDRKTAGE